MSERTPAKVRIRESLRLGPAVRLVWQASRGWTIAGMILSVVQGVLPLAMLYLIKLVVDTVAEGQEASGSDVFARAMLFISLAAAVAVAQALCGSISGLVSEIQSRRVTDHVQDVIHSKSIEVDLEYYENSQYYDTLHRAQQEAPYRPTRIVDGLAQLVQSVSLLGGVMVLLFKLHWGVALILFAAAVPGALVRLKYADVMYEWREECALRERQADYFSWMLTGDIHAKEVRLFGLGSLFMERYRLLRKRLLGELFRISKKRTGADLLAQIGSSFAVFGSFAFMAYRAISGAITLGDLVMYFQALRQGLSSLRQVLTVAAGFYEDNLFLSHFYEFLRLKPKVVDPPDPLTVPRPMEAGVAFHDVDFQYPTGHRRVLEGVNLVMRPGEIIALVGENGSGKTTLIKLLCRLYNPSEGTITVDGIDVRKLGVDDLRREISVIFQDYARYHLTARENIWLGNVDLRLDDEEILAAAKRAGAHEVISKFENGYDSMLGKRFEEGEELSVGEWQKVALARAFLRDSQVVVLDEPTSAMDAKAEYELFLKFRKLIEGRSAILISHRFSTVRMADRIYVMKEGRIVEDGTHQELLDEAGMYARLFKMQAQYYT